MRFSISLLICVTLLVLGRPLSAQTPMSDMPSPEEMEQMMEAAKRMMNPAALILAHRSELQLTGEQAAAVEQLENRMTAVIEQHTARHSAHAGSSMLVRAMQDPTLKLDEQAIRAEACEQAKQQAELSIEMIRTKRGVAQVLTSAQQQKLTELEAVGMMRMMQGMFDPPKRP